MKTRTAALLLVLVTGCAGPGPRIPVPEGRVVDLVLLAGRRLRLPGGRELSFAEAASWLAAAVERAKRAGEVGVRVHLSVEPTIAAGDLDAFLDLCAAAGVGAVDVDS